MGGCKKKIKKNQSKVGKVQAMRQGLVRGGLLSCCLTSTEARWPIRDGDRVGRGGFTKTPG